MIYAAKDKLKWAQSASGLIVPADCKPKPRPKAFDFFAGCGGFSCGLHSAGFQVIGALEMDYSAAQTYMVNLGNHPMKIHFDTDERAKLFDKFLEKQLKNIIKKQGLIAVEGQDRGYSEKAAFGLTGSGWISTQKNRDGCEHFWIADIYNITGEMILKELGMEKGELDLVVGSPPCQGLSSAGKQDENDPRNDLTFEYGRLICELNPKTLAMENVPEIATMHTADGISILDGFLRILADGDYAPMESLRKSLLGRKGAKAIVRSEKKQKVKKKTLGIKKAVGQSKTNSTQASLF